MQTGNQKAFTMIELVFVIVVIGILSAIALPRFGGAAEDAYFAKAKTTLVTVRVAMKTERQKRILRGDFTKISDLGLSSAGASTTNAFDHFSGDGQTPTEYAPIFTYPIVNCATGQRACWDRTTATTYSYRFPTSGQADFVLDPNKTTLDCDPNDTSDCALIIK